MHVVEVGDFTKFSQNHTQKSRFFVRMNEIVSIEKKTMKCGKKKKKIQNQFGERWPGFHFSKKERIDTSEDFQSRDLKVRTNWIGDQVYSVALPAQGPDSMIFRKGGTARRKERLRSQHEDFHDS